MNSEPDNRSVINFLKRKGSLFATKPVLLGLSFLSLAICAFCAVAHYRKWGWGDRGQVEFWLAGIILLLLAFLPRPRGIVDGFKSSLTLRTAFFAFWILVFAGS